MRLFIFAMLFGFSTLALAKDVLVTIKPKEFKKELQELSSQGFDIAGVNLEKETISIVLPEEAVGYFKTSISNHVVKTQLLSAPDDEYLNPDEINSKLREYASAYPDLARFKIIGNSVDNRLIWALKISKDAMRKYAAKKVVLFDCQHHAREVMTPEVCMDTIDYLLTRYATDSQVKSWLDNLEIWVVPTVNPDGNARVFAGSSMWRKNTKGGYGVDINRNYPYKWGTCNGSSGSTGSDTYRGPSAGSEPETQALMNLVAEIKPKISISYHSFSELVIYPMGCQGTRVPEADRLLVEGIGKELATKLKRDSGSGTYSPGTAWELLYSVDGGDIDWFYAEHKVIPFVIEVNSDSQGFQPSYSQWRNKTVEKMRPGWQFILDKALTL